MEDDFFKHKLALPHKARWLLYRCCVLFSTGQFKTCLKRVDEIAALKKPSPDLNLNLRILRILCFIERSKFDLADKETDSLRKFVSRNKLTGLLSDLGLQEMFAIFWQLRYCGYDFTLLEKRNVSLRKAIEERTHYESGCHLTNRTLPFVSWLKNKVHGHHEISGSVLRTLHVAQREQLTNTGRMSKLYA